MKRYIVLALLLMVLAVLAAKPGLFDLSFDESMADAHQNLLAKGFQETDRNDLSVRYKNDHIPGFVVLEIRDIFDDGHISSWTVRYDANVAGLVEKIVSDLTAIHALTPIYNVSNEAWTWELDYPYGLSAKVFDDESRLVIEYMNDEEYSYWELFDW